MWEGLGVLGWESVDGDDDEAMEAHDDTTRGRIDGAARGGDESLVGLPARCR